MTWLPRLAVPADAEELVRLRELMFGAMGLDLTNTSWRQPCVEHFRRALPEGRLVGVAIDAPDGNGLACCAVAEISGRPPSPTNPTGVAGYVSNVCTDPGWRRNGMARVVMEFLLARLDDQGVPTVHLHATDDGRPLYESLGFDVRGGGVELSRSVGALITTTTGNGLLDPAPPARG